MTRRLTMAEINALDRDAFVALFGGVFEHSPWVAEAAWRSRPFASAEALLEAMLRAVREAPEGLRTALIRAHPDLGARIAMTEASAAEQRSAGLDRLTAAEYGELAALNRAYRETFGFPFILAVRGKTKREVLAALRERIGRSADEERREALRQIGRIAAFRLAELVEGAAGGIDPSAAGEAGSGAGDDGRPSRAAAADAETAASGPADEPVGGGSGRLTTHVLDVTRGRPAAGMRVELYRLDAVTGSRLKLREVRTNADGRTDGPILAGRDFEAGAYELVFHAGEYFRAAGADIGFLDKVPVRFRIADPDAHCHVPLLAAPGGYSTYRGS